MPPYKYSRDIRIESSAKAPLPFAEPPPKGEFTARPRPRQFEAKPRQFEAKPRPNASMGSTSKLSSTAKKVSGIGGKKGLGGAARLGINAKGDISLGLGVGSIGVGVSAKGDISLGLGVVSVTINPKNPNDSAVGFGLNTLTIEGKKEGCTTTLFYKILGTIVNTEIRIDPACEKPEPINTNDTNDSEDINKNDKGVPPQLSGTAPDPVPVPLTPGVTYAVMYSEQGVADQVKARLGQYYWFLPDSPGLGNVDDIGQRIVVINGRLSPSTKLAFYEALGTGWTFAPWANIIEEAIVPQGQNNAGTRYLYGGSVDYWLSYIGGNAFEPNFFKPNQLTRAFYVHRAGGGNDLMIENFTYGLGDIPHTKFFPGTPNVKIIEVPPLKPRPKTNTPTRTPIMDDCCEEIKEVMNDVYDMLGGDIFRDNGLIVPNELFIPEADGDTKVMTYNTLFNILFRALDHRTPGQVEVKIKDNNKSKKGEQPVTFKSINATGYYSKLMELQLEGKGENADQLQILMRLGWISTQILKMLVICSEAIKTIVGFFDIPTKEVIEKVDIPFNPSLNKFNKGFKKQPDEKKILQILDMDTEDAAERILADFNDVSQMPVTVKKLRGGKEGGTFWWLLGLGKK